MPNEDLKPISDEPLTTLDITNLDGALSRLHSGLSVRYGFTQLDTDLAFKTARRLAREWAVLKEENGRLHKEVEDAGRRQVESDAQGRDPSAAGVPAGSGGAGAMWGHSE